MEAEAEDISKETVPMNSYRKKQKKIHSAVFDNDDLLLIVLGSCSSTQMQCRTLRLVCKRWECVVNNKLSTIRLSVGDDSAHYLIRYYGMGDFLVDTAFEVQVRIVSAKFKNVTSLTLKDRWRGCYVNDKAISHVSSLTNLTSLDLSDCRLLRPSTLSQLRSLTKLTDLNLESCFSMVDDTFATVLAPLTGLTSLGLARCYDMTDRGVLGLTVSFPSLTSLDLSNNFLTDEGIRFLASFTGLTKLKLSTDDTHITYDGLSFLSSLTALTVLRQD